MTLTDPLSLSIPLASPSREADPSLPTRRLLQPSPSHPDDYILEIDNSSLEVFTTCPRSAENYLVRSRESSRDGSATSFGKLFHSCEELRLRHGFCEAVAERQRELVYNHFLHAPPTPGDHRTPERMLQVLRLYNERYANDRWHEKVLTHESEQMVERSFKVELCTLPLNCLLPYSMAQLVTERDGEAWTEEVGTEGFHVSSLHILWTGRIDAVLSSDDSLWVVDHKTSSIGGPQYFEDFRLSNQTVGYCWAAQKLLGLPVSGLILNAIIMRRPTKAGKDNEFDRRNFWYSADRLREWEENAKNVVSDFVANLIRGFFPQHTKWCCAKYGICQYHENCSLPRENRSADLASSLYRNVTWNPITEVSENWTSPATT